METNLDTKQISEKDKPIWEKEYIKGWSDAHEQINIDIKRLIWSYFLAGFAGGLLVIGICTFLILKYG